MGKKLRPVVDSKGNTLERGDYVVDKDGRRGMVIGLRTHLQRAEVRFFDEIVQTWNDASLLTRCNDGDM